MNDEGDLRRGVVRQQRCSSTSVQGRCVRAGTRVDAGIVTIDQVSSEDNGPCGSINFDPLVLPPGIEASDDPLLSARSSVYARSFMLRSGEAALKPPSLITPRDAQRVAAP